MASMADRYCTMATRQQQQLKQRTTPTTPLSKEPAGGHWRLLMRRQLCGRAPNARQRHMRVRHLSLSLVPSPTHKISQPGTRRQLLLARPKNELVVGLIHLQGCGAGAWGARRMPGWWRCPHGQHAARSGRRSGRSRAGVLLQHTQSSALTRSNMVASLDKGSRATSAASLAHMRAHSAGFS